MTARERTQLLLDKLADIGWDCAASIHASGSALHNSVSANIRRNNDKIEIECMVASDKALGLRVVLAMGNVEWITMTLTKLDGLFVLINGAK